MLKMHERLLTLAVVACALIACAGPVSAALTVEIIQPDTDPFTSMVDNPAYFEAVAYIDGQELPGGEVTWDWDFGDQTAHSTDNPTTHTFTEVGEYTVTVTASYGGQQAQDTAIAVVEEAEPSPGTGSISVYVAHDGTWLNYRTQEYEEAEIEDAVAVFIPPEQITDEPEVWAEHQINDPQPPAGWAFYAPVEDEAMELHIIIRDTGDRLGEVVVTNRDTGALVGTLDANGVGSEIEGALSVDPTVEAFNLNVKNTEGATLILAGANITTIRTAVPYDLAYVWHPNRGDEHECPRVEGLAEPWGDPRALTDSEGHPKTAQDECGYGLACNGPQEFHNDQQNAHTVSGKYHLQQKAAVKNTLRDVSGDGMSDEALDAVTKYIAAARDPWLDAPALVQDLQVPPFSEGVAHFPTGVNGTIRCIWYFPYKGRTKYKGQLGAQLQSVLTDKRPAGLEQVNPQNAVTAAITWTLVPKEVTVAFNPPVEVGELWGLTASTGGAAEAEPCMCIPAPVTFELWADLPPGFIGGTGLATKDAADTTPAPPYPMPPEVALEFPEDGDNQGRCTVELGKGWKWKATGEPSMAPYSGGEVGPFPVVGPVTKRIECNLEMLLSLKIKTVCGEGEELENVEANVELERKVEGEWWPEDSGQSTQRPNGEYIWGPANPLAPGGYRARAAGMGGWSDWLMMNITIGLEDNKTITVPEGQEP